MRICSANPFIWYTKFLQIFQLIITLKVREKYSDVFRSHLQHFYTIRRIILVSKNLFILTSLHILIQLMIILKQLKDKWYSSKFFKSFFLYCTVEFTAVFRVRISFHADPDPDPGSLKFPYGSGSGSRPLLFNSDPDPDPKGVKIKEENLNKLIFN